MLAGISREADGLYVVSRRSSMLLGRASRTRANDSVSGPTVMTGSQPSDMLVPLSQEKCTPSTNSPENPTHVSVASCWEYFRKDMHDSCCRVSILWANEPESNLRMKWELSCSHVHARIILCRCDYFPTINTYGALPFVVFNNLAINNLKKYILTNLSRAPNNDLIFPIEKRMLCSYWSGFNTGHVHSCFTFCMNINVMKIGPQHMLRTLLSHFIENRNMYS